MVLGLGRAYGKDHHPQGQKGPEEIATNGHP